MYRSLLLLFLINWSFALYGQNSAQESSAGEELLTKAIANNTCVGISAGFIVDNKIPWISAAGVSIPDIPDSFTWGTPTRIASLAKPMTAVAVLQLSESGRVDLDTAIQAYIPEFPVKPEGQITVRQLLTHTSGIGDYKSVRERENTRQYDNLEEVAAVFMDRDLVAPPGSQFFYSSYNYVLLGIVIERTSGMSFGEYMRTHIWEPAGMETTGIERSGSEPEGIASLFHRNEKGKINQVDRTNLSNRIPGGGVYSTTADMLQFCGALLNNTLLQQPTLESMFIDPGLKNEGNGYGMGWYLYGVNPKYGNVVGHTGGQTGCSAMLMLLPELNTGIVVLSNTSGAMQAVTDITIALFDISAEAREGKQ